MFVRFDRGGRDAGSADSSGIEVTFRAKLLTQPGARPDEEDHVYGEADCVFVGSEPFN